MEMFVKTFHSSYYSVLVTNFSSIVLFSVGDKLFHPSYYSVLVTNFSFIVLYSVGDKSLSPTLNSTMDEKFVTNTE
jgi:hypothetical protein